MKLKKLISGIMAGALALSLAGCTVGGGSTTSSTAASTAESTAAAAPAGSGESSLKGQNVRVVIGSTSTSGDSYMIADLVTRDLPQRAVRLCGRGVQPGEHDRRPPHRPEPRRLLRCSR